MCKTTVVNFVTLGGQRTVFLRHSVYQLRSAKGTTNCIMCFHDHLLLTAIVKMVLQLTNDDGTFAGTRSRHHNYDGIMALDDRNDSHIENIKQLYLYKLHFRVFNFGMR